MKVLITGGAGFLGLRLARTLLTRGTLGGQPITSIVLADLVAPPADLLADSRVQARVGALLEQASALGAEGFDGVFHLASAVSAECETDFDLGLHANLDTTRALLDALRARVASGASAARVVFASSVAVYGSDAGLPLPAVVREDTLPTPQSSYGIHKFINEQLIADYTRKGFIDGRTARLMTVSVRPGRPNGAASSFLSGIIREPLAGLDSVCPVSPDTQVALSSPASTIAGLITVFEATREAFGGRTAVNLPALTVSVKQMLDALREVGGDAALSHVRFEPNPAIAAIVGGWPAHFQAGRSLTLGLVPDADFIGIVRQYIQDHPQAVVKPTSI